VNGSAIADNGNDGINATNAAEGDATDNWWGQPEGPTDAQCVGNVDCSSPLTESPVSDDGDGDGDGDDSGLAAEFDLDDDTTIDRTEVIAVIVAFNDPADDRVGDVSTAVGVINEFNGDARWENVGS